MITAMMPSSTRQAEALAKNGANSREPMLSTASHSRLAVRAPAAKAMRASSKPCASEPTTTMSSQKCGFSSEAQRAQHGRAARGHGLARRRQAAVRAPGASGRLQRVPGQEGHAEPQHGRGQPGEPGGQGLQAGHAGEDEDGVDQRADGDHAGQVRAHQALAQDERALRAHDGEQAQPGGRAAGPGGEEEGDDRVANMMRIPLLLRLCRRSMATNPRRARGVRRPVVSGGLRRRRARAWCAAWVFSSSSRPVPAAASACRNGFFVLGRLAMKRGVGARRRAGMMNCRLPAT